jgi:glycosyltransferase involved in cell wall biosynthesis
MKLLVISHKPCWVSPVSPTGYATDGGFPFQMRALSELFDATTIAVPCSALSSEASEAPLAGHNLTIRPLTHPASRGLGRKAGLIFWLLRNGRVLLQEIWKADAVHTPIPGDIGTLGMLIAFALRKPLFVRHCGNWLVQRTLAERFWRWFLDRYTGGKNVALATGGTSEPPSRRNPNLRWIFSTSLTEKGLRDCWVRRNHSPAETARLIIVCRQESGKGTEALIESLPLILKDFPRATLDVVGDGRALAELRRLALSLAVDDRVTFHGKVDHSGVIRFLRQADLFCFPTSSEGFPKVVLEALACGLPVVTTRVSVLPQLIETGCGVLLEKTTPAAIAEAVRSCLGDTASYHAMSAQAMEMAAQYSLERWRDTIGDFLQAAWGPLSNSLQMSKSPSREYQC